MEWDTFILMLLSVFVAFFFSRVVIILDYFSKILNNQNTDNIDIAGARIGLLFFFLVILALVGAWFLVNGCLALAYVFFGLAFVFSVSTYTLFEMKRHKIAHNETRGFKLSLPYLISWWRRNRKAKKAQINHD